MAALVVIDVRVLSYPQGRRTLRAGKLEIKLHIPGRNIRSINEATTGDEACQEPAHPFLGELAGQKFSGCLQEWEDASEPVSMPCTMGKDRFTARWHDKIISGCSEFFQKLRPQGEPTMSIDCGVESASELFHAVFLAQMYTLQGCVEFVHEDAECGGNSMALSIKSNGYAFKGCVTFLH